MFQHFPVVQERSQRNLQVCHVAVGFTLAVDIDGEGCIMIDENGVRAGDEDADCTLTADAETFQGMLSGDVNPTSAFMSGGLQVDGDMSAAMKLGALLS